VARATNRHEAAKNAPSRTHARHTPQNAARRGAPPVNARHLFARAEARVTLARPGPAGGAAERLLLDHAGRQPARRAALVLHLSRLPPPGPRPHHRRVARAVLEDHARLHDGQVFALRNGDMVLLGDAARAPEADPAALLHRLLRMAAVAPDRLVSVWPLGGARRDLLAYAAARLAETVMAPPEDDGIAGQAGAAAAIDDRIGQMPVPEVLRRQAAALLDPARPGALRPLFREIAFAATVLEARLGLDGAADPFLFRHLAARLDRRLLEVLCRAAGGGGPLDPAAAPAVHVNLTPAGILSDDFPRFAAACRAVGAMPGVEVEWLDACADPPAFARARARLDEAGMPLVLDGVAHLALLLARPWRLAPGLLKLDWSPLLATLPAAEAAGIDEAVARIGPARIVLHRADSEAALHWGVARGIRRFQGAQPDAMLAAGRLGGCGHARDCTLRQCMERASASGPAGRHGCRDLVRLDGAA